MTAPNGDIFVADGHGILQGQATNDRIVKLSKDGTFIKAWGKQGSEPGEFDVPHSLALDSAGRLMSVTVPTAASRFSMRTAT